MALAAWFFGAGAAIQGAAPAMSTSPADRGEFEMSAIHHIDMRAAALLMSGQRGGGINGVLTVGAPIPTDGKLSAPFWIELERPPVGGTAEQHRWTLEIFVYALDEELNVDSFEARVLRLDLVADEPPPHRGGLRVHGRIEVSPAARIVRVLVRDRGRGEFYLDEKAVPLSLDEAGVKKVFLLFPDTGGEWTDIGPGAWTFGSSEVEGCEIDGNRYVPSGLPVIATPSELDFFVVGTLPEGAIPSIAGSLWNDRGTEVRAGDLSVVSRLPTATEGLLAHAVTWRVPDLDPGRYLLDLSLARESGIPIAAEISVIAVPPATASERPTWVTLADTTANRTMPRTSAADLAYLDALGLCASGQWNECVESVVEMEGRAIRNNGGAKPPAELFALEGSGITSLAEHTPSSMISLLALYHDVFRTWVAIDDPVGQRHSVRVIAAMANDTRKRPALAPAKPMAVAVLASIGDILHRRGVFDSATAVFELALELDPTHQASLLGIAADHEWLGHHEETVEALQDLGRRPDALFEGRLHLGVNLLRIGKRKDAITELRTCTDRSAPAWVRVVAYEELALSDLDNGRTEQAKALIEEATAEFPEETTLRLISASIEEARGNLGEARRVLTRLDQRALSPYRESPRKRYARWPSEVFAEQRRRIEELAREHLDDLASAVAAQPDARGP